MTTESDAGSHISVGSQSAQAAFVAGCAFVAAALVILATRHGPAVTPDSVSYLASARNVADGRGLLDFTGRPLATWPPGYPLLLAGGIKLGIGATTMARLVSAASMAATVLLTFVLLRRHVTSTWTILAGTALVAISPTLLRVNDSVWSDGLFCALVLVFVLVLESAVARPAAWGPLVLAAITVWPAFFVRYAGLALIPAGALACAWAAYRAEPRSWRTVVLRSGAFTVVAAAAPVGWVLRNHSETGSAFGYGTQAGYSGITNLARDVLVAIGNLVVPDQVPNALKIAVAAAIVVIAAASVVTLVRASRLEPLVPVAIVVVGYVGFSVAAWIAADTDVSARILAPVYALFVVFGLAAFDAAPRRRGALVAISLFAVWSLLVVGWAGTLVWTHGRDSRGYAAPSWEHSGLIAAVRSAGAGPRVFSNDGAAVAYWTGSRPVLPLDAAADLRQAACVGEPLFANFGERRSAPRPRSADRVQINFVLVDRADDGTLYSVHAGDGATPDPACASR